MTVDGFMGGEVRVGLFFFLSFFFLPVRGAVLGHAPENLGKTNWILWVIFSKENMEWW